MKLEHIREYCVSKKGVEEDFPFDHQTLVMKVGGKIFALCNVSWWHEGNERINLKCDPDRALELREHYASVIPGYHMSKKTLEYDHHSRERTDQRDGFRPH